MVVDEFEVGPLVDLLDGDVKVTSIPFWNEAEIPRSKLLRNRSEIFNGGKLGGNWERIRSNFSNFLRFRLKE